MFARHWIVADMDGTLTPTPSRAHGSYLSLSHCMATGLGYGARYHSCLPWLRLFLERGGSLCVVSTAGKRMWAQLYQDLAPSVFNFGVSGPPHSSVPAELSLSSLTAQGTLYMCGFTGAAMFRTRPCDVVWADMDRLHPGWRVSVATPRATTGKVETVFFNSSVPPAAIGIEEWAEYRQQAVGCAASPSTAAAPRVSTAQEPPSLASTAPTTACSSTTLDAATYALAATEGRNAIIRFFEHASYVSGHNVDVAAAFFAKCLSTKYHSVFTDVLRQLLDEVQPALHAARERGAVPHLCFADSQVLNPAALATHGCFLKETNDALVDVQRVPRADGTVPDDAPVAQVVVMGIPMRYFDRVFPFQVAASPTSDDVATPSAGAPPPWQCCAKCAAAGVGSRARLEAAGLELKSQPNSVCLHRRGVDKGMCVRWLLSQGKHTGAGEGRMCFELSRALAFGDVPESVDRPLTTFPPMQFISLSPKEGAATRLAEMQAAATASSPYLYYVGGEEEGTALFLEELFTSCLREADEEGSRESLPCDRVWFTPQRVSACAARAHAAMTALLAERNSGSTDAAEEPSRSTL